MTQATNETSWFAKRITLNRIWREHFKEYYAPKNFNFWYFFGSLAMLTLAIQLLTGIWLTMHYTPSAKDAFASVEYIMREVNYGWLLRYMHSTGASAFFIVIYLHIFRALLYGSYKTPRELVWYLGVIMYLLLLAEAFCGYLLPWGQMSYWAAQVITSLFTAIPVVGAKLALWIRGDFNVADATLHRFFALHVIAIPLVLLLMVWLHILALHTVGSNNPDGIDIKKNVDENGKPRDGIAFHPYYTVKDMVGATVFLIIFASVVFFAPEMGGYFLEHANFQPANPLMTPDHIAPVWYMTPFYAILRAIPDKLGGVIAMFSAVFIFFLLPLLDRSPVRSMRYRGWLSRTALTLFAISFIGLGYLGAVAVTPLRTLAAQILTVIYFAFFLLMPVYTKLEKCKPLPERLT